MVDSQATFACWSADSRPNCFVSHAVKILSADVAQTSVDNYMSFDVNRKVIDECYRPLNIKKSGRPTVGFRYDIRQLCLS